jgi:hypothetical protein
MIETTIKNDIQELRELLLEIDSDSYRHTSTYLQASIGQHIRHVIELYQELIRGYDSGMVNYADRKRDMNIGNDPAYALEALDGIENSISRENKALSIIVEKDIDAVESNYHRELIYNLEHSIHHQALVKVGLLELEKSDIVSSSFGIAPSTITFRKQLSQ